MQMYYTGIVRRLAQGFDIGEAFFGEEDHFLTRLRDVGTLVSLFLNNAIVVAGVVFVFLVIIAGFNMITGAGSANAQQFAKGRDILVAAIIGFIIVFAAWWIAAIVQRMTTGSGPF